MGDETSGDQNLSYVRSLEAAIADSAIVNGETGVLLRRTLTDFGSFATELEEEAAESTKEQLENRLKSIVNFRVALDATINSVEGRINSIADDAEKKSAVGFIADEIKEEEMVNYDMVEPKEEPIDFPLLDGDESFGLDYLGDETKEEILIDDLKEPKEEPIDAPLSEFDQQFNLEFVDAFKEEPIENEGTGNNTGNLDPFDGCDMGENGAREEGHDTDTNMNANKKIEGGGENETAQHITHITKDSSETEEVEKRRRSSRNLTRSVKYSMKNSDWEEEPYVKKKRSESVEDIEKDLHQKRNSFCRGPYKPKAKDLAKNELKCPECKYRSRCTHAWVDHLKLKHSTTPTLAGCLLRCNCGYESYSHGHRECEISNFTIIRTGDGTIRRLTDPVTTPQCVLCKVHPKTPRGYTDHLKIHHKSTLIANGVYLKCACGYRCTSHHSVNHDKKCTGRDFTLHKLDED